MPLYEYHCPSCGNNFERLQAMSAQGSDCPVCEQPARRAISVFASASRGDLEGSRDYLLMLFPQEFWLDATIWVATRAVLGAGLLVGVFGGYLAYQRWTEQRASPKPVGTGELGQPES